MSRILLLQGPNLNLLGTREPHIYGSTTLADIEQTLRPAAEAAGHELEQLQSNAEHILIDRIHAARDDGTRFILINPGAFTHTSVAIRDALAGVAIPFIEVHISNIHSREEFRHTTITGGACKAVISGLGAEGYSFALRHLVGSN